MSFVPASWPFGLQMMAGALLKPEMPLLPRADTFGIVPDPLLPSVSDDAVTWAQKLGDGAAIKVKDNSVMCDQKLVFSLHELAKKKNIPYQTEVLTYGGTDASSMQTVAGGSRAGGISIPIRFCHTPNEIIDMTDVEACVDLIAAVCEEKEI